MTDHQKEPDTDSGSKPDEKSPAGPHDTPELTDKEKTPGTGMLPDADDPDVEAPSG
jgi:hypothetical protein